MPQLYGEIDAGKMMNSDSSRSSALRERSISRAAAATFVAVLLIVNGVRFVHLDADFPAGVTTSRALYTDEGLYSANALNLGSGRPWYIPGELNPIINLPVAPVLQAAAFRLFGPRLTVARGLVAGATLVLIGAAFALTLQYAPITIAGLVALTLSVNFLLFSYSRLAIFDVVMTMVLTLAFAAAMCVRGKSAAMAALAGAVAGLAVLTKTTAVCALPAIAYLCGAHADEPARKRLLMGIALATCALVVVPYNALAWSAYPRDYVYFHSIAETRLASGLLDVMRNFGFGIVNAIRFAPWLSLAAFALTVALFRSSAAFRNHVLVRTSAIWTVGVFLVLSITSYQPSRYFVVVLVPLTILFALALLHIADLSLTRRTTAMLTLSLVAWVVAPNAWRIADYLMRPHYSFVRMAREVDGIVNGPSTNRHHSVLLGNMAPSISLATGVRAVSVEYGTRDLGARISAACPGYFITLQEPGEDEHRSLSPYYAVEPVQEWTVFGNYFERRPVRLFRLHTREDRPRACPRP